MLVEYIVGGLGAPPQNWPGISVTAADGMGGRSCTSRLGRVTVALPPVESTDEFFDPESQLSHVQRTLGGGIAADTVAVGHDKSTPVERGSRCLGHRAMGKRDGARDVLFRKGLGRTRVDDNDSVATLDGDLEVP